MMTRAVYQDALKAVNKVRKAAGKSLLVELPTRYAICGSAKRCALTLALKDCGANCTLHTVISFQTKKQAALAEKAWKTTRKGVGDTWALLPKELSLFVARFDEGIHS